MAWMALTNLDTGLFFDNGKWTHDYKLAHPFPDRGKVSNAAKELKVKNAAAALIEGNPPRVHGYFWIAEANRNST